MTRFLWVTDSWPTLDHNNDTSLRLAQESIRLGFENYWAWYRTVRIEEQRVIFEGYKMQDRGLTAIIRGPARVLGIEEFTSIQYRPDPPVDLRYLHHLQLLHLGCRGTRKKISIVNPPEALFQSNEKLEAFLLKKLMPPTFVASQWEQLRRFGKAEGKVVLKPLHQAQSRGVELLEFKTPAQQKAAQEALAQATAGFIRPALLQRFLPGIRDGELRLWFLDGKLLAQARKFPAKGDFRVNIDRGSRLAEASLSASDRAAARAIGKHLRTLKIRLAAVDLIDGYITDFNFTSPGLIVQMEKLLGKNLARPIILALAKNR